MLTAEAGDPRLQSPLLMAGLPVCSAIVSMGPPLLARPFSSGLTFCWSLPLIQPLAPDVLPMTLKPIEVTGLALNTSGPVPAALLLAMMVLPILTIVLLLSIAPP